MYRTVLEQDVTGPYALGAEAQRCRQATLEFLTLLVATSCTTVLPSGCSPPSEPVADQSLLPPPISGSDPAGVLGEEADRRFDFGPVVGDSTRGLTHTFTLRNRPKSPIKILGVTNGMPCCGEVQPIVTEELAAGQPVEVTVKLRTSKIGPLRHWASMTTDRPAWGEIVLVTFAQVYAPLRIEPVDDNARVVGVGETFAMQLNLIETCSKPAATDSRLTQEPSLSVAGKGLPFRWEGSSRDRSLAVGLVERVRPFSVTLTAGDQSGADGAELVVDNLGPRLTHPIRWNVAAAIRVEPAFLSIRSGQAATPTFVLKGIREATFEIVGLRCSIDGLVATRRESDGARHVIEVAIGPGAIANGTRLGEVVVTTTLAAQKFVTIPVFVIGGKEKP